MQTLGAGGDAEGPSGRRYARRAPHDGVLSVALTPARGSRKRIGAREIDGRSLRPPTRRVYETRFCERCRMNPAAPLARLRGRSSRSSLAGLLALLALAILGGGTGCSELRGRRKIREGNQAYREGRYEEAVAAFEQAEKLVPDLYIVWLNKGIACRQLMVPGGKPQANDRGADCALAAFQTMRKLRPDDHRAEVLYVQTLFDSDRFKELAAHYEERLRQNPTDGVAMSGLIQVYTRWNRLEEALHWYQKRAALASTEAEAQYAVGVFLWNQLFQKGGGAEMAAYNPLENQPPPPPPEGKNKSKKKKRGRHGHATAADEPPPPPVKQPPPPSLGDIYGAARIRLADLGISYLEKALALRPQYLDAMTYMGLLYRQKSFAYFNDLPQYRATMDAAEMWRKKVETATAAAGGKATGGPSGNAAGGAAGRAAAAPAGK